MKIEISIPNDYGSDEDVKKAIDEIYHGDIEACESDEGRLIFDELSNIAKSAGLVYVGDSDHGAIWEGKSKSIKSAIKKLPRWAYFGEVA